MLQVRVARLSDNDHLLPDQRPTSASVQRDHRRTAQVERERERARAPPFNATIIVPSK